MQQQQQQHQLQHAVLIGGAGAIGGSPSNIAGVQPHSQQQQHHHYHVANVVPGHNPSFLGGIFHKRERKLSKSDDCGIVVTASGTAVSATAGPGSPFGRSTEV